MSNENKERKKRVPRQNWKPHWFLKLLYGLWTTVYSALKVAIGAVVTVLVILGVCLIVFVGILGDYLQNDIIPQAGMQLEGMDLDRDSCIYYLDDKGNIQVLQEIYAEDSSQWVYFEDIPKHLIHATVAIEDKRFYEHQGVDWFTTIKACLNMFMGGDSQFGGSSITQQLVKNLLLLDNQEDADDVTVQRKVLEIFRATELERRYDKDVIMEWYLNNIYLGERCKGVKTAAAKYFGKELEHLTAAECASLISITNNPSKFNPYRETLDKDGKTGYEQNLKRRTDTLWVMRNEGYLTEEEYRVALDEVLVLKDGIDPQDKVADCPNEACAYHGKISTFEKRDDGVYYCPICSSATTIGEDASQEVYSWFVDVVLEDVAMMMAERDGFTWNKDVRDSYMQLIGRGGYHIYTTLNMEAQQAVDKIYTNLEEIPADRSGQQLESGLVMIDNKTGDIVAIAGGVGEKTVFDAHSCATDALLQPGSSIKPLTIYAPAFEMGVASPATVIKDMPIKYTGTEENNPFPKNDNRKYQYSRTIYRGIVSSVNGIAVNTLNSVGFNYSYTFAKDLFGLSTLVDEYVAPNGNVYSDLDYSPLGMGAPTIGVTVRDMATAYATFANNGVYREARTFTKVYNSDGEVVLHNDQESRQILSKKTVDYINYCLDMAVYGGTGTAADLEDIGADGKDIDVAGKTGTTASNKDRWFCGFTNYYTAAVWVGYRIPEEINLVGDTRNPAARLWNKVMTPLHQGKTSEPLYDDTAFVEVQVCLDSGKLATNACRLDPRGSRTDKVKCHEEDVPTEVCTDHVLMDCCSSGNAVANEYCQHFASVGQTSIVKKALTKLTRDEVNAIFKATNHGLSADIYRRNDYIYLVDNNDNPVVFTGIDGLAVNNVQPYLVCTQHTREAWLAYIGAPEDPSTDTTVDPTEGSSTPSVSDPTIDSGV